MRSIEWDWPSESLETNRRATEIARTLRVPEPFGMVLATRGMSNVEASVLADRPLKECTLAIGDPEGIDDAAAMLLSAGGLGRMGILCDYDVDGATAQTILIEALRAALPSEESDPVITVPHRNSEGFGPNDRCLNELSKAGISTVLVLDCGTAAGGLLDQFHSSTGIVPIVVDHHPPHDETPPKAGVMVNPWVARAPDPGEQGTLCTAGLAWFLARAILRQAGLSARETAGVRKRITLLAALGTSCDMMRVDTPFNRSLTRAGVRLLSDHGALSPGLRALCHSAGLKEGHSADDFGWKLGPRINAGSRMGESDLAARCLREKAPSVAAVLAEQLDKLNQDRVALGREAKRELDESDNLAAFAEGPVNVHVAKAATPGTVGLVASALVKRFGWPAVTLASRDDGLLAGSGRSALGFDIGAAVGAAYQERILLSGGGHAGACGVKLEPSRLEDFGAFLSGRFKASAANNDHESEPRHQIDAVLAGASLATKSMLELSETQQRLAPWGQGLPLPVFGVRGCSLVSRRIVSNGHVFLTLACRGQEFSAVWWSPPSNWQQRIGLEAAGGAPGNGRSQEGFEIAGEISLNEWRQRREGRIVIRDARTSGS